MATADTARHPLSGGPGGGTTVLARWLGTTSGRLAIAMLAWAGVCIAWTWFRWGGDLGRALFGFYDLPFGPLIVGVAWLVSRKATLSVRTRRGWLLIAIAVLFYWLGSQTWNTYESILKIEPWPSLADVFWLLFYPTMFAALLQLAEPLHSRREQVKFTLDAVTVLVAGTALIWYFVLSSVPVDPEQGTLETAVLMAYPIGDLLLAFGMICVLLKRQAARRNPVIVLTLIGMAAVFGGDMIFLVQTAKGTYETGGLADACFLLWFAFMVLAAEVQHLHGASDGAIDPLLRQPYPFRLSPYVAVLAGYALLAYDHIARGGGSPTVPLVTAVVLSLLIIVRQVLAAREIARLHAEQAQRRAEERFASLVKHSSDMVLVTDADGVIRLATPAVERVLGWEPSTLLGSHLATLLHHDDVPAMKHFCREAARTLGVTAPVEWRLRNEQGTWQNAEIIGSNLLHDASINGLVLNCRDVTERRLLEEQLKHLAFHDPLTLLANRNLLNDRIQRALASAETSDLLVAVLFVDLDNFKKINDSLGHDMGDKVLVAVAERFNRAIRPGDTIARLGGDEFAILLDDAKSAEDVTLLARRIIETMKTPIDLGTKQITITGSVGIAIAGKGERVQDLTRNADVAMYRAKSARKGSYEMFEASMHKKVLESMEVELDLRHALERREFMLAYQPIVDLRSSHVVGMETLVRWRHPKRGPVPPAAFIPVAEESDLIIDIGRWVLFETCLQGRAWQDTTPSENLQHLAVNISGRHLQHLGFVDDVNRILLRTGINPKTLVLEITESVVMQDIEVTLAKLRALKALGVSLAMDDFGTGYSSLSYLHQFPFDILKIDRSFINQIGGASESDALVRTIVALGQTLGLKMVAEGIERPTQLAELKHLGCAYGQGYLFGKPTSQKEATAVLAAPRINPLLSLVR